MNASKVNVVILGGGLVGGLLAVALAKQHLSVAVIDRTLPEQQFDPNNDGRTTAVNYGSKQIFEELGLWDFLMPQVQEILEIRVFEKDSPWSVDYDHKDIGLGPMGYIVENHQLRRAIHKGLDNPLIQWFSHAGPFPSIERGDAGVELTFGEHSIKADLLVGAEGKSSPSRAQTNIKTKSWDYGQMALVIHLLHQKPHNATAWEVFSKAGPLAVLPMRNCPQTDQPRSGLVWMCSKDHPRLTMSNIDLEKAFVEDFPFYGSVSVCSKRWVYPLTALSMDKIIDKRYALVGDAAHGIHPIAGQGVNLGWRDAAVLAEILGQAKMLGLDIGSTTVLNDYQKQRQKDHKSMTWATDGIVKLFNSESSILRFVRNAGFAVVNQVSPLKRYLMRQAMGI